MQGILPCIASELTTELSINQSQLKLIMWIVTKLSAVLLSYGYFVHWSIIMNIWTSFPNVPLSLFAVTTSLPPHWTISTHHFSRDAKTILRTGPLKILVTVALLFLTCLWLMNWHMKLLLSTQLLFQLLRSSSIWSSRYHRLIDITEDDRRDREAAGTSCKTFSACLVSREGEVRVMELYCPPGMVYSQAKVNILKRGK